MTSSRIPQISEAELEVMKVLWQLGAATSGEIIDVLSESTDWKPKTIGTLINRLVAKKAVVAKKTETRAYLYVPLVEEENYKVEATNSLLAKLYNGSVQLLLTSFIRERKLSQREIEDLKKLLDEEEKA